MIGVCSFEKNAILFHNGCKRFACVALIALFFHSGNFSTDDGDDDDYCHVSLRQRVRDSFVERFQGLHTLYCASVLSMMMTMMIASVIQSEKGWRTLLRCAQRDGKEWHSSLSFSSQADSTLFLLEGHLRWVCAFLLHILCWLINNDFLFLISSSDRVAGYELQMIEILQYKQCKSKLLQIVMSWCIQACSNYKLCQISRKVISNHDCCKMSWMIYSIRSSM